MRTRLQKIIISIVMLAVLMANGVAALASNYGYITGKDVLLCAGPSSATYKTVKKLQKGSYVIYSAKKYGTKKGYVKAVTAAGKRGYVAWQYIKKVGSASDSKFYTLKRGSKAYNAKHYKIGYVGKGDRVILLSKSKDGWCKVKKLNNKVIYLKFSDLKKGY